VAGEALMAKRKSAAKRKSVAKRNSAAKSTEVSRVVGSQTPRSRGRARAEGAEFPLPPAPNEMPASYVRVLAELKARIGDAQRRAALSVTRELIDLYWHVGAAIVRRQADKGWGDAVVERLAHDLRAAFPEIEGFSRRNIWRMRAFFLAWSRGGEGAPSRSTRGGQKLPQAVAEIPWGHNIVLLEQLDARDVRLWYAGHIREHGWSRATLIAQIAKRAHARQGKATTNFARALRPADARLAQQALKDPYTFDFLTVGPQAHERVLEGDLVAHVREFLLELGTGFAFIGNQVKLTVAGEDYFLDLLFYHVRLRCYVVVELKASAFRPEHAGKMNFYLSAVDDLLKHRDDKPSIGLLLCRSRNRMQVEYALRDMVKPIGVARWETKLFETLPEDFRGSLPTVEELEAELGFVSRSPSGPKAASRASRPRARKGAKKGPA
jgi:predicted nuclease of restriction endonuclease-like (RecB) superfamily